MFNPTHLYGDMPVLDKSCKMLTNAVQPRCFSSCHWHMGCKQLYVSEHWSHTQMHTDAEQSHDVPMGRKPLGNQCCT